MTDIIIINELQNLDRLALLKNIEQTQYFLLRLLLLKVREAKLHRKETLLVKAITTTERILVDSRFWNLFNLQVGSRDFFNKLILGILRM